MHTIAIFASGAGTNAENLIRHFQRPGSTVRVALLLASREGIGAIARAEALGVETVVRDKTDFLHPERVLPLLAERGVEAVILSGFLLLVPPYLLEAYPSRVVNIHPALLPLHGGKGMYGDRVHRDVLLCGDKESGITIHVVDERYDRGETLFQATCPVLPDDTPESLAQRVHQLEYRHFPHVVEEWVTGF